MRSVLFKAVPFAKEEVTLALESGVDGLIVPAEHVQAAASLARCRVISADEPVEILLRSREDEQAAARQVNAGHLVILNRGWEIIPVENLLAQSSSDAFSPPIAAGGEEGGRACGLALEVLNPDEARLAAGILEKGVHTVVVPPAGLHALRDIVEALKQVTTQLELSEAVVTEIVPVGMGHRVCVDTLSMFSAGQGMLIGNSAAFTFLVNAETERNEYVASRPFRINAGAVHAYALMPGDRTSYLAELAAGSEVLVADYGGKLRTAVVGRVKVEQRPMLLIRAKAGEVEGAVFLQNAETIRLVIPGGASISVVALQPGDRVLCRLDAAGRHFGMRIAEDITEL